MGQGGNNRTDSWLSAPLSPSLLLSTALSPSHLLALSLAHSPVVPAPPTRVATSTPPTRHCCLPTGPACPSRSPCCPLTLLLPAHPASSPCFLLTLWPSHLSLTHPLACRCPSSRPPSTAPSPLRPLLPPSPAHLKPAHSPVRLTHGHAWPTQGCICIPPSGLLTRLARIHPALPTLACLTRPFVNPPICSLTYLFAHMSWPPADMPYSSPCTPNALPHMPA